MKPPQAPFGTIALNRKSPLAKNLVLAYPIFNDRRLDSTGDLGPFKQKGTPQNGPPKSIAVVGENFKMATASSQWIRVGGNPNLNALAPISFSMWVNFASWNTTGAREIFTKGNNYFYCRQIGVSPTIEVQVVFTTTNLLVHATAAANSTDGNWHHLCLIWDGTNVAANLEILWDGATLAHGSNQNGVGSLGADTSLTNGNGWGIFAYPGGSGSPANFVDGSVTLFALWNRVLGLADVNKLISRPWEMYRATGFYQMLKDSGVIGTPAPFFPMSDFQLPQLLAQ